MLRRLLVLATALTLLVPQATPAAASAMPEAPNCPVYRDNNVWHSSIRTSRYMR